MQYIKNFEHITLDDIAQVGGKNASLGYMITSLQSQGVRVPTGFAITADAYWYYLTSNNVVDRLKELAAGLTDYTDVALVSKVGSAMRACIEAATIPSDLAHEITMAYDVLCQQYGQVACDVAVRSSATAEDLPDASFAGQQETYLNISGHQELLEAYKKSLASLFTDRALVYRAEKGFDHFKVALSTGVQKMVRSDLATSGVIFTLDTDSGFSDVVMINAAYGLGELVVKGEITPDEFCVHKPTFAHGFRSIIKKQVGSKEYKLIYGGDQGGSTFKVAVPHDQQIRWCLSDDEICALTRMAVVIEQQYSARKGSWCPMDIEWAKDGIDGQLYIVQARPETVYSTRQHISRRVSYTLEKDQQIPTIVTGSAVGQAIASGKARVIASAQDSALVKPGDIIVTHMTDPDWVPVLKKAAGIITSSGGRTCHAAIVSRELGIPAIVGAEGATELIAQGQDITIDCSRGSVGYVYNGIVRFARHETAVDMAHKEQIPVSLLVNIAAPESAFTTSFLPNDGVGLARVEFIISNNIKVHPMACAHPELVLDETIRADIYRRAAPYTSLSPFFVDTLARGIATIAAAFYPKPVVVRTSDFKSNEYRNLVAGSYFEPTEENPMLGLRGASRYYHPMYQDAFALECAAFKKVREEMGLTNVKIMIPFVRSVPEARKVIACMQEHGLVRGRQGLELIMMCEIPSNVLLIDQFSALFDGFSIGSNDLTQLTLGVDRDSGLLTKLFDERDEAVQKMLTMAVEGARRNNVYISICGQAPSDYPEIAHLLIRLGINALSLNPDTIVPFINEYTA